MSKFSEYVELLRGQWKAETMAAQATKERLCAEVLKEFPIKAGSILKGRDGPLLVHSIYARVEMPWTSARDQRAQVTVRGSIRKKTKSGWHSTPNEVYDFQGYVLYEDLPAPPEPKETA